MADKIEYKILERETEKGWTPFAIAYRRGDRVVLFNPAWRAHRKLPVTSLDELIDKKHLPSANFNYRWSPAQICEEDVTHPIDLFRHALARQQSDNSGDPPNEIKTIPLLVQAPSPHSAFSDFVPFVINPGSNDTIIPRRLTPPNAFPVQEANKSHFVTGRGPAGDPIFGRPFSVYLAQVSPLAGGVVSVSDILEVIVSDSWEEDYAVLGLEAQRRMKLVPN